MEKENNKNVLKPITLVREDFIAAVANAINESQLQPFVIESVLKDFLNEVHMASVRQIEADRQEWEKNRLQQSKLK